MQLGLFSLSLVLAAACTPSVSTRPETASGYDILITNARVVDGTGNPWYRGSVATRGDRIAYVGPSLPGMTAKRVIDARDQVVSPGFVDMLGHSEDVILRRPQTVSKITQGITSEITGEVHSAWPNVSPGEEPNPNEPWTSLGGFFAEHITVFDPATIIDNSTFERPQQLATGVNYVIVNGVPVLSEGKPTGSLPGKALRGPGYKKR